jgi:hypothetical protein
MAIAVDGSFYTDAVALYFADETDGKTRRRKQVIMDFNNQRFQYIAGGLLMLLFTSLFFLGMLSGCAGDAKSSDPHWDRNCQKQK